jgi:sec-independent protein translocase protein TatB
MFGLGFGEILIILVLALVLLGPSKLPDAAKQLGKGLREFKKATDDLRQQFEGELYSEPKPQRPRLVEPPPVPAAGEAAAPPGAPAPAATADNVPGLEAALAEPARPALGPGERPVGAVPASAAVAGDPLPGAATGEKAP